MARPIGIYPTYQMGVRFHRIGQCNPVAAGGDPGQHIAFCALSFWEEPDGVGYVMHLVASFLQPLVSLE